MSGQQWPLGSEVRRKDLTGASCYMTHPGPAIRRAPRGSTSSFWRERGEIDGEAQGRGTTHFIHTGKQNFVLRHYRRGGLVAKLMKDRYFWRDENPHAPSRSGSFCITCIERVCLCRLRSRARYQRHGLMYTAGPHHRAV